MVLVRPLDTAAIPGQPGSGAVADKILVNLVNFENAPQTVEVAVTLPSRGVYSGSRYGNGMDHATACHAFRAEATPEIVFKETLAPGEGVQYILSGGEPRAPYPPLRLAVESRGDDGVALAWAPAAGADRYEVRRVGPGAASQTFPAPGPAWEDREAVAGTRYAYAVRALGKGGASAWSASAAVVAGAPARPAPPQVQAGDGQARVAVRLAGEGTLRREDRLTGETVEVKRFAAGDQREWVDAKLVNGRRYRYSLAARNRHGESRPAWSQEVVPSEPAPVPGPLTVAAIGGRAMVSWPALDGVEGYEVERAEGAGPFAPVGKMLPEAGLVDVAVVAGKQYRYRVRAVKDGNRGRFSAVATVTVAKGGALPAGWRDLAIGSAAGKGGTLYDPAKGLFAVGGAGHDIWANRDGLRFVAREFAGDFTLVARLVHFENTHQHNKFGLMARAGTAEGARMFFAGLSRGDWCYVNIRAEDGGETTQPSGAPFGCYLKLERRGDVLTAYSSPDATLWRKIGETPWCGDKLLAGLAVCSHDENRVNTVLFDEVKAE